MRYARASRLAGAAPWPPARINHCLPQASAIQNMPSAISISPVCCIPALLLCACDRHFLLSGTLVTSVIGMDWRAGQEGRFLLSCRPHGRIQRRCPKPATQRLFWPHLRQNTCCRILSVETLRSVAVRNAHDITRCTCAAARAYAQPVRHWREHTSRYTACTTAARLTEHLVPPAHHLPPLSLPLRRLPPLCLAMACQQQHLPFSPHTAPTAFSKT